MPLAPVRLLHLRRATRADTDGQKVSREYACRWMVRGATDAREWYPTRACCGDPDNLGGLAHPWKEIGEDDQGTHYQCPVCGAYDVD
ncbi:hypothetical protein GCM10022226_83230 [Sphaerisporangium flaviroseum]|uniref:Rubredoxin-like domain-containing protein n=1 Tax=Sphaerisporangium flaviroseum TaxID=509199 RepID=A0ABP7JL89_9ACTN